MKVKKIKKFLSIVLRRGDVILLRSGIHGFIVDKDCKFLEFKQGPFSETLDKKNYIMNDQKDKKI